MQSRSGILDRLERSDFDVLIVGAGINGACLYDRLCRDGYRVGLIDRGDFACATSQASTMMVWGGLLYLANMDFAAVRRFSRARDAMIDELAGQVAARRFYYLPAARGMLGRWPSLAAMYLYWAMGGFARRPPRLAPRYPGADRLKRPVTALTVEEASLVASDARFVLSWIAGWRGEAMVAANHVALTGGQWQPRQGRWRLQLTDRLDGRELLATSRFVVNCAGVWTDAINEQLEIRSPIRHAFSKGVTLAFQGEDPAMPPMILANRQGNDVLCSVRWGPVDLWGSTETAIAAPDAGFAPSREDIDGLLAERHHHFRQSPGHGEIISLRCGVRPLAVPVDYAGHDYPLTLSRRSHLVMDDDRPWLSVYGGKLTGCRDLAAAAARALGGRVPPPDPVTTRSARPVPDNDRPPMMDFPGLADPVPDPVWCRDREACHTLDDYLRRRTNIAQWLPRQGLGWRDENLPALRRISLILARGDEDRARSALDTYCQRVRDHFDPLIGHVSPPSQESVP